MLIMYYFFLFVLQPVYSKSLNATVSSKQLVGLHCFAISYILHVKFNTSPYRVAAQQTYGCKYLSMYAELVSTFKANTNFKVKISITISLLPGTLVRLPHLTARKLLTLGMGHVMQGWVCVSYASVLKCIIFSHIVMTYKLHPTQRVYIIIF